MNNQTNKSPLKGNGKEHDETDNEYTTSTMTLDDKECHSPDQVLAAFGNFNAYILLVWVGMGLVWALAAMPMMESAFIIDDPQCVPTPTNITRNSTNITLGCNAHDNTCYIIKGSVTREFNTTKARALFSTSLYWLGDIVGAISLPLLADKIGRHPVLCWSLLLSGITGIVSALSVNIEMFMVFRFLQGIFFPGCGIINWTLAYESIPKGLRSQTHLVFGLWWVLGYCLVSPFDYAFENWRWLAVACALPSLMVAIVYFLIMPESFHFLSTRGDMQGISTWIDTGNRFARCFKTPQVRNIGVYEFCERNRKRCEVSHQKAETESLSIYQRLMRNIKMRQHFMNRKLRNLLIYTAIFAYLWTCDAFLYYGLSIFSTTLNHDNRHLNYLYVGLAEIPSYLFSPTLLNLLGRRIFVSGSHLLTGICFIVAVVNESSCESKSDNLELAMWIVAKFAISCAFTSLFVYASEVFPTVSRNSRIGVCAAISRVGGALVPSMSNVKKGTTLSIFAGIAVVASLLTIILPETLHNADLPDSDSEVVEMELPLNLRAGVNTTA